MSFMTRRVWVQSLFVAIVCGVLVSLVLGLVENPSQATIIGAKQYGYPLVWRIVVIALTTSANYRLVSLIVDIGFWITISFLGLAIVETSRSKRGFHVDFKMLVFLLSVFLPLGFCMAFIHEGGHVLWGTAVGGRLTYMQVAFFEFYPRVAVASRFGLGVVTLQGLEGFNHGLFLLGGSLTTNIVAWIVGVLLLKMSVGRKIESVLRVFSLFGILDLPFYVLFPQIGLRHWIIVGWNQPEPLIGAREMGLPDPLFYGFVMLTTLGLLFLHFKSFRDSVKWGAQHVHLIVSKKLRRAQVSFR